MDSRRKKAIIANLGGCDSCKRTFNVSTPAVLLETGFVGNFIENISTLQLRSKCKKQMLLKTRAHDCTATYG